MRQAIAIFFRQEWCCARQERAAYPLPLQRRQHPHAPEDKGSGLGAEPQGPDDPTSVFGNNHLVILCQASVVSRFLIEPDHLGKFRGCDDPDRSHIISRRIISNWR